MPRFSPLLLAGLLSGGLAAAPVVAQTSSPAPLQPAPSQDAAQQAHQFLDRFNAANTTHDGRLTLQQAQPPTCHGCHRISPPSTANTRATSRCRMSAPTPRDACGWARRFPVATC